MIEIRRDLKNKNRFILAIGDKSWHLSYKEVRHLYKKLVMFKVWLGNKQRNGVAQKIRAHRKQCSMTQAEMAHKLGLDKMAIYRWETGKCLPSKMAIERLKTAKVL